MPVKAGFGYQDADLFVHSSSMRVSAVIGSNRPPQRRPECRVRTNYRSAGITSLANRAIFSFRSG
jgi:hypothetical protein